MSEALTKSIPVDFFPVNELDYIEFALLILSFAYLPNLSDRRGEQLQR